jgi:hypothetical protein
MAASAEKAPAQQKGRPLRRAVAWLVGIAVIFGAGNLLLVGGQKLWHREEQAASIR